MAASPIETSPKPGNLIALPPAVPRCIAGIPATLATVQDWSCLPVRNRDDYARRRLTEPLFVDSVRTTLAKAGVELESNAALDCHLGERDRKATQADIVGTAGDTLSDQTLDKPLKTFLGVEVERRRRSNHLPVHP